MEPKEIENEDEKESARANACTLGRVAFMMQHSARITAEPNSVCVAMCVSLVEEWASVEFIFGDD